MIEITFVIEDEGSGLSTQRSVQKFGTVANTEKVLADVIMSLTAVVLGKSALEGGDDN